MGVLIFETACSVTFFTNAAAPIVIGVLTVEFVPMNTVRFSMILCRDSYTSKYIDPRGYYLKMIRVNTTPIPAEMIKLKSVRNWAY